MQTHSRCPKCRAAWVREEYQPVDRIVVTCRNGHRFVVGEVRRGDNGIEYLRLTRVPCE